MLRRRPALLLGAAALAFALVAASPGNAADGHWSTQAEAVAGAVTAAEASFVKGDMDAAKRLVTEAYFRHFEDSKLEAAIRRFVGAKRATEIEKHFAVMRKAMSANDAPQVKAVGQSIREAVAAEAKGLDAAKIAPSVFEVNQ